MIMSRTKPRIRDIKVMLLTAAKALSRFKVYTVRSLESMKNEHHLFEIRNCDRTTL